MTVPLPATDLLDGSLTAFRAWVVERALPFWADRGFDPSASLFEEQLGFDGAPDRGAPRRVMVQARQISVYALAAERGWWDGRTVALAAGDAMVAQFWARDGHDGWTSAIDRTGAVVDARRDLYAHAFVLFALAWLVRLSPDDRFDEPIRRTLRLLEAGFADLRHGGYWDALPTQESTRRQNPHMHLLEAFLELHAATGDDGHLAAAARLVALADRAFIDTASGSLREIFDEAWVVSPAPGRGSVEPGHQFEWASLLRRFEARAGVDLGGTAPRLVKSALTHGVDRRTGRVVDEVGEDGIVRRRSSRCWPHTEALKSLAVETWLGTADYRADIAALLWRLTNLYCPDRLGGGWIDRLSETDAPISRVMPASSLYHLAFALAEAERCFA